MGSIAAEWKYNDITVSTTYVNFEQLWKGYKIGGLHIAGVWRSHSPIQNEMSLPQERVKDVGGGELRESHEGLKK